MGLVFWVLAAVLMMGLSFVLPPPAHPCRPLPIHAHAHHMHVTYSASCICTAATLLPSHVDVGRWPKGHCACVDGWPHPPCPPPPLDTHLCAGITAEQVAVGQWRPGQNFGEFGEATIKSNS